MSTAFILLGKTRINLSLVEGYHHDGHRLTVRLRGDGGPEVVPDPEGSRLLRAMDRYLIGVEDEIEGIDLTRAAFAQALQDAVVEAWEECHAD